MARQKRSEIVDEALKRLAQDGQSLTEADLGLLMAALDPRRTQRNKISESKTSNIPPSLNQPTFSEIKRLAQAVGDGADGTGWVSVVDEFALAHVIHGAVHTVKLEGDLVPVWWGRPSNQEALLAELRETGQDGIATLYVATALLLAAEKEHVDLRIDDIIGRIGIDPRSHTERIAARTKVWRILTVLAAARVIGDRRLDVWDSVRRRNVRLTSQDPLIVVTEMREEGTQPAFDGSDPPLAVSIFAGPLIQRWRHNRSILQHFGDLLTLTSIPIGKPSGAWARTAGQALHQIWREQATKATYGRAGDDHRVTAQFRPITRRELLTTFRPQPPVEMVLKSNNPSRAIDYWDDAMHELRQRNIIAVCTGYGGVPARDWKRERPRLGWTEPWLDEPLDIRPPTKDVRILATIKQHKTRREPDSKVGESELQA